jgi:hypothetical protein
MNVTLYPEVETRQFQALNYEVNADDGSAKRQQACIAEFSARLPANLSPNSFAADQRDAASRPDPGDPGRRRRALSRSDRYRTGLSRFSTVTAFPSGEPMLAHLAAECRRRR